MSRKRNVLVISVAVIAIAVATLAVALSYSSACPAPEAPPVGAERMKAIVQRCYGSPAVLKLVDRAKPSPAADEILVKVHAAAINPLDWHFIRGEPYIMRLSSGMAVPNDTAVGVDFSGTVEAVGRNVHRFKVGDAVFGGRAGALAEYVTVRERGAVAHKPENLSFEQAAAIPIAAVTALQGLRDKGRLQAGQKVLINGASVAWARSPYRSRKLLAPKSREFAARVMSSSCARSARTASSITRRKTSTKASTATT